MPSVPPSPELPYNGKEETGSVRASLQHSLDQWKPGQVNLTVPAGVNLDRSHTRSFGESHSEELKQIVTAERQADPASPPARGSFESGHDSSLDAKPSSATATASADPTQDLSSTAIPSTTSAENSPVPIPNRDPISSTNPSTATTKDSPINPAVEPNKPAPIQLTSSSVAVSVTSPGPVATDSKVPSAIPNVAETSGSSSGAGPKHYESAEEEKKRLEREERERFLRGQTSGVDEPEVNEEGETPPPYPDI